MHCTNCGEKRVAEFIYCPFCGVKLDVVVSAQRLFSLGQNVSEKEAIENYFLSGFAYEAILCLLNKYHGIEMSLSTLKRRLAEYNLRRRKQEDITLDQLTGVIRSELDGPGCLSGYRSMWHTLRIKYGIVVPRREVEELLSQLDPDGVQERKRHKLKRRVYNSPGPNYCWHVDGYDKLKPYGLPIHGAIDGYSRRVMWLVVSRTNNDPDVMAKLYFDCVKEVGGCPRLLTTDCGTENGTMADMQMFLRAEGNDELSGEKSHRYVPSPKNQRIEAWWSFLRRSRYAWWINFFKDMVDSGKLASGNELHDSCVWFCFSNLIQEDLDFVRLHWNTHTIRHSNYCNVSGVPDELYFLPETTNATDHLQPMTEAKLDEVKERCRQYSDDSDFLDYFQHVMDLEHLQMPRNWREAIVLFEHLVLVAQYQT